jgi:3-oxoacyl-[acyl-carrier-protein] synthase II
MPGWTSNKGPWPRRIVITGLGVVAPNGATLRSFWETIVQGTCPAGPVQRFDASRMSSIYGCEVTDFHWRSYMDSKWLKRSDLSAQFSVGAACMAVDDAGLEADSIHPDRIGVVEGTTVSGMESILRGHQNYLENKGYHLLSPMTVVNAYTGEGSSRVAMRLGIHGHAITLCSGCASGNDAIGYALQMIRQDDLDVMLAGATDDMMIEPMYAGFCLLGVMTKRKSNPAQAMRPFDYSRDGFILGEGSAFLVLEELSHALARGAKIYAEVIGHGRSCEAHHPTDTHPDGVGLKEAMEKALRSARLHPAEVDYINAHGTATPMNDPIESQAIRTIFGPQADRVAVSSTKPVTGHTMGAAGAIEAAVCALAIQQQEMPPNLNLERPAVGCDLDYVRVRRPYPIRAAMNLNAGFGGRNACLILRAYPPRS